MIELRQSYSSNETKGIKSIEVARNGFFIIITSNASSGMLKFEARVANASTCLYEHKAHDRIGY